MRYGSLFSGAGGLDLAVEQVTGATAAWHVEADPHASSVLAARWPGVPNHGDVSAVDWSAVEPVDVLCGGFPCQDLSIAGRGAGIKEGTRSGLWYRFVDAIRVLRPRLVVVENVRALLVRGFDAVLGCLADLGYDASWTCLPASAVGACHRRERVFLVAWPAADAEGAGRNERTSLRPFRRRESDDSWGCLVVTADGLRREGSVSGAFGDDGRDDPGSVRVTDLLPTPEASDSTGGRVSKEMGGTRPSGAKRAITLATAIRHLDDAVALLPTPVVNDMGDGKTVEWWEGWKASAREKHGNGNGHGNSLSIEVRRSGTTLTDGVTSVAWGHYAPAIARHEAAFGRPAPHPVDDKGRLSPLLVEWMMGWPAGWVTDVLPRRPALRVCGNAVVPAQAAAALRHLLGEATS